jgi:putative polyhydroxyalkanoate system protein
MSTIHITKSHQLDQETARDKVQELANMLGEKLSAEYKWEKDRLVFKRSGANGFVRIGDQELEIEVKLGMMLRPLKGTIEKTITDYLEQRLT